MFRWVEVDESMGVEVSSNQKCREGTMKSFSSEPEVERKGRDE
jgi:hypothetical protein